MASETVDERDKLQLLVSAFSNAQQDQYEIFRRSTFPKSTIRKLMQGVCGGTVPQNAVIAMAGITKVCVCVSQQLHDLCVCVCVCVCVQQLHDVCVCVYNSYQGCGKKCYR